MRYNWLAAFDPLWTASAIGLAGFCVGFVIGAVVCLATN